MTCSECRTEYLELRAFFHTPEQGSYRTRRGTSFHFSYLQDMSTLTDQLWGHVERAGRQVIRLVTEITVVVGRLGARFKQIPSSLSIEALVPVPPRSLTLRRGPRRTVDFADTRR